jgi:archaellum component FlaC
MNNATLDKRLDKIDAQIEKMALTMVKGFAETDKKIEASEARLKNQIDIYARAVDAYAKQAKTYMQEMLALGAKVDRLEKQIEQIATHLNLKLTS